MNILVTGRGAGGSWNIRGAQLGAVIGAQVDCHVNSVKGFDLAVVVKRPRADVLERLRQREVPVVWDIVDAWPQPVGNGWGRAECLAWLRREVATVRPAAIVAASAGMAEDCADLGVPVLHLPHHARPGQRRNPVRENVRVLGYEGGEQYLGTWEPLLREECKRRGWGFFINPTSLADVDIVVAVRDCTGYAARSWKSNVKLACAQGSGTPCVLNRERAYVDAASGAERWADTAEEMTAALDRLTDFGHRMVAAERLFHAAPSITDLGRRYRGWLVKVAERRVTA